MTSSASDHAFSGATAVHATGEGRFDVQLSPDWTIAGRPNGGYLLAILGRAVTDAAGEHRHVLAASAHYLRAPEPGPAHVEVQTLRSGRSASQHRARLVQGDLGCVEVLVTSGRLVDTRPDWSVLTPTEPAPFTRCVRIPGTGPGGFRAPIFDVVDARLDPADTGFAAGAPSGRGELRGWLELPAQENFDAVSLLYAVDAFPPATFEIAPSGWVPTLELTVYVRALPAPGPVRVHHRAQLIDGQRVDETCWIWDAAGRLVAQSTQLAGIRLA